MGWNPMSLLHAPHCREMPALAPSLLTFPHKGAKDVQYGHHIEGKQATKHKQQEHCSLDTQIQAKKLMQDRTKAKPTRWHCQHAASKINMLPTSPRCAKPGWT
eukprot:scaffold32367_cov22-Tisochrysis_lutea.AAC.3